MNNALSVYVTEWYHHCGLDYPSGLSDKHQCRLVDNIQTALNLLGKLQTKATFFILGVAAERHPDMVKMIELAGHEVASLGYRHKPVYDHTAFSFREDIKKSRLILQQITGKEILGYRAPDFSLTGRSPWAMDILCEEGFKYDASFVPARHPRYGQPDALPFYHRIRPELIEFPLSTIRMFGQPVCIAGGGAFKRWPYRLIRSAIQGLNRQGRPAQCYFYIWELDEQRPAVNMPALRAWKELAEPVQVKSMLTRLLSYFQFLPVWEVLTRTMGEDEVI